MRAVIDGFVLAPRCRLFLRLEVEELLRVGLVRIKVNVSWGLVTSWRQFGPYLTFNLRMKKTAALGT